MCLRIINLGLCYVRIALTFHAPIRNSKKKIRITSNFDSLPFFILNNLKIGVPVFDEKKTLLC
jgi:hypothetical protein